MNDLQQNDLHKNVNKRIIVNNDLNKVSIPSIIAGQFHTNFSWYFFKYMCRGKVYNVDNLIDPPYIIAANHVSYMDWSVLFGLFRKTIKNDIVFIAKKKLFENAYFKLLMEYSHSIFVDQEKVDKEFLKSVYRVANTGKVIGIFPEGKRTEDGKLIKAFPGVGKIALMTGLSVIPVGLNGFYEMQPKGAAIPRIANASINIGKPIRFSKKDNEIDAESYTRIIMKRIASLTNQEYNF
jgi:1-acyl-sn-glycerol-3-phosphate acyltransferase